MEMLHTGRTYHDITGLNDTSFFSINSGSAFTTKNSKDLPDGYAKMFWRLVQKSQFHCEQAYPELAGSSE